MYPNIPGAPGSRNKTPKPRPRKPAVVIQPGTYKNVKRGIDLIANVVRPTLGPLPRLVAIEKITRNQSPEFLDDGSTIARRIIQLKKRSEDVGAMLLRNALWKMHEEVGDGSTTMAVMYQVIFGEGVRYVIQSGCNPMMLRNGLGRSLKYVVEELRKKAEPLKGRDNIAALARGMCQGDLELARLLGEILDIVGPEGMIQVENWNRNGLEREYVEGTYWDLSGFYSHMMETDPILKRAVFEDAAVFISDLNIKDHSQLIPVLEKAVKAGIKNLVFVVREFTDGGIGLLVNNNRAKTIQSFAVRTPRITEQDRVAAMEDIAILTGGKPYYSAANETLEKFKIEDLGYARRAWATESLFGIFGGKGNPRLIRQRMNEVRIKYEKAPDEREKDDLQKRLGRLLGGTAILRIGAPTETERDQRKLVAERAVASLRHAIKGGVVPGGGVALLNCQRVLYDLPVENEDEKYAHLILARALEEPLRVIVQNSGYIPDTMVDHLQSSPEGYGLDVRNGRIVDMKASGIVDPVNVLVKALEVAVSSASMALTTDVIIHRKKPEETVEP